MDWTTLGRIADILGIIGFFISLLSLIFSALVLSHFKRQKSQYREERKDILTSLCALRESIWSDGLNNTRTCDKLQSELYAYRMKYWLLSSPLCHFHLMRCIHLLNTNDFAANSSLIRHHLNYIIARLQKKE